MQMDNYLLSAKEQKTSPIIMEGSTGDDVIILQDKLKILGYYDYSITGSFDGYTKNAVMKFQNDYNLPVTGVVNMETWQALYQLTITPELLINEYETRPTLRLGSTGTYVRELQGLLESLLYYDGPIDGVFGFGTQTAVKMFQTNNRLTPDGVVGRDTWSALFSLYAPMAICEDNGNGEETITYIVVAGDNLWNIARRFNTTVEAIKRLNNLTTDVLQIGQKLLIPAPNGSTPTPPNYITYTVVAGDSLWLIARRFNTTVDAIKRANNLTTDVLQIGQKLLIPTQDGSTPTPPNYIMYTVVAGDNLWDLARRFNTTVEAIKRLNNLTSDRLSINQQLKIPTSNNTITYTVVAGDSLWLIARRFNTTVDAIKRLNNLTSDTLRIGQILIIQQ